MRPREPVFYDLFTEAATNLVTATRIGAELVSAPAVQRPAIHERLRDAEHQGDEITHRILKAVNSTFVTPFDREDIYRLASRIDDVLDFLEEAGDLIVLYGVDGLPPEAVEVARLLVEGAERTAEAMPKLRTMSGLEDYWIEVNRIENEADRLYRRMIAGLFRDEGANAVTLMKYKDVIDHLEEAADALEHVADVVQTVVAKES
nr:DUF47 family protein [Motilibacter deserti]